MNEITRTVEMDSSSIRDALCEGVTRGYEATLVTVTLDNWFRALEIADLAEAVVYADTHYANVPSGPNMEVLERTVAALRDAVLS